MMEGVMINEQKTLKKIRIYLILFLLAFLFSLHTVVFIETDAELLAKYVGHDTFMEELCPSISAWIEHLNLAVSETYSSYPFFAYCMDYLVYASVVLAIFLLGAIKDPVKNVWVVQVFMVACCLAFILPFIVGPLRDIPVFWRCIDSSCGLIGLLFFLLAYRLIRKLEALHHLESTP
jgi:hypothetical protein